jgi:citrate synthase
MNETANETADSTFWDAQRGVIRSRKGGWKIGKDVVLHGHSLFNDLMGRASWCQVWLLSITGRLIERHVADYCEAFWMTMSFPDPRIWCNQVSALAGTMRCTPVAGVSSGTLTSDSLQYAGWAISLSADFLAGALRQKNEPGFSIEEFLASRPKSPAGCPVMPGYSRPVALGDERVTVLHRLLAASGIPIGEHLRLALALHHVLLSKYGEQINAGGFMAAFLLDQDFTLAQIYAFFSNAVQAGAIACYIEAADRPAESFLPMRCDDVDYQGPPPREFPATLRRSS